MSYTVLARRYRSGTFDEVVGQAHIAQTLKRAIESDRIAHAYLFTGTRGTGKTSTARILAKALNCHSADKPTISPCGKCESCIGIARGDDIDVIEIDAASNTQVDKTREAIIEHIGYSPANSRFKIFIIDEVHMLSKSSFNALLKTLEEPPSHVKFILATTEPEKIPNTILSRCQRYDFRNIPTREIADHLKEVCKAEKVKADDDALLLVARAGAGSMRDALSLLDRLLSMGESHLTVDMIEGMLGLPKSQLLFDLAQAIGEGDTRAVLMQTDRMISAGQSADGLIASLVEHLRNLLILRACGADCDLVDVPGLPLKDLIRQSEQFDAAVLAQDIAILEELRRQVRQSGAGRALLDAALVRLALSEQFASVGELLGRVNGDTPSASAPRPAQKKKPEEVTSLPSPSAVKAQPPPISAASVDDDDDLPAPGKVWDNSGPSLSELLKQRQAPAPAPAPASEPAKPQAAEVPAASNVEPVDPANLPEVWQKLLDLLARKGPGLPSLLSHARLVGIDDGRAIIRYAKHHETFVKMFERNGKKDQVRDAFSQILNQNIGVAFDLETETESAIASAADSDVAKPSIGSEPQGRRQAAVVPVRREIPRRAETAPAPPPPARLTQEQIDALRESDPLIKALMDELGAQILKVE
jgi:DNA polymerase-3 subunit gamma/tau